MSFFLTSYEKNIDIFQIYHKVAVLECLPQPCQQLPYLDTIWYFTKIHTSLKVIGVLEMKMNFPQIYSLTFVPS